MRGQVPLQTPSSILKNMLNRLRGDDTRSPSNGIFNSSGQQLLVYGYRFLSRHLDLQAGIPGAIFWNLYYAYKTLTEGETHKKALELVKPDTLILDVGANIGFFSIFACRHTRATVLSFEPEPKNYHQLCTAIKAKKLEHRVVPQQLAVNNTSGDVDFYLSELSPMDHKLVNTRSTRHIKVPGVSVDDFLSTMMPENDRPISLIKIDVQGLELKVLSGMTDTLKKHGYPPILVEFSPNDLQAAQVDPKQFLTAFAALNYVPHDQETRKRVPPEELLALKSAYTDLLMLNDPTEANAPSAPA